MAWQKPVAAGGHTCAGQPPLGCGSAWPAVYLAHMSDASDHLFLVPA
jgi:hypothetical protein